MNKLLSDFYNRDTLEVAKDLLGKKLVHNMNGEKLTCRITEVEAYCGITDKACHTYGGRRTKRTEVMWGSAGYAYIYLIYGMYYCLNVVTQEQGQPCAVLIRGLEPLESIDRMAFNRYNQSLSTLSNYQLKNFTNGPGKLCQALGINKNHNGLNLEGDVLYILDDHITDFKIHQGKRINIGYAEEAADYLWRFYIEKK